MGKATALTQTRIWQTASRWRISQRCTNAAPKNLDCCCVSLKRRLVQIIDLNHNFAYEAGLGPLSMGGWKEAK